MNENKEAKPWPCAICGKPEDLKFLVRTGGGCDYPVCSAEHNKAVWLWLDSSETADVHGLPAPPNPIRFVPPFMEGSIRPGKASLEEFMAYHRGA